ncbi:hypothetical protein QQF64_030581 [Cirrhinus molitorella]|uniref:Uncharacterized protein n=1 Tax=Cirrhinus molitorella TaxID=172907 RepID=A0ABR3N3S1_9TELE
MEHRCGYIYFYQASKENMSSRDRKERVGEGDYWVGIQEERERERERERARDRGSVRSMWCASSLTKVLLNNPTRSEREHAWMKCHYIMAPGTR